MTNKRKKKLTSLAAAGLVSLSLGGTGIVALNSVPSMTVQAFAATAREKLKGYIDKAKIVLANKSLSKEDREAVQGYYDDAVKAYSSNNAADIKVSNIGLGGI